MDFIKFIIDFILHIDVHLAEIINSFGLWTYAILFVVVFIETGLVVTPFLPGDSLLFAAGALAKLTGALDIKLLYLLMVIAAVAGDTANYWIGRFVGPKVFIHKSRLFKKEYLDRTQAFYENNFFSSFCADHSHFCTICGRYWENALWLFHFLQHRRRHYLASSIPFWWLLLRKLQNRSGKFFARCRRHHPDFCCPDLY
jgi:membrane protein YqaA with SNARE-associated domain